MSRNNMKKDETTQYPGNCGGGGDAYWKPMFGGRIRSSNAGGGEAPGGGGGDAVGGGGDAVGGGGE